MTKNSSDHGIREWDIFINAILPALNSLLYRDCSMEHAWNAVERFRGIIDEQMLDFIMNTISEVDGYPEVYASVVDLLNKKPTIGEFMEYMNSPA